MINEKDFEQGLTNFNLGKDAEAVSLLQDTPPQVEGEAGKETKPMKVAGIGRSVLKGIFGEEMGNVVGRSSYDMVKNIPKKEHAAPIEADLLKDAMKQYGKDKSGSELGGSSTPRASELLQGAETESDIERLINNVADIDVQNTPRTFKDIEGDMSTVEDVMKEMEGVFTGSKGQQLLTDRQVYGIKRIMTTAQEDMESLATKIVGGDESPETLLQYENAARIHEVLLRFARGNSKETGRALNAQKMISSVLNSDDLRLYGQIMEGEGGDVDARSIRRHAVMLLENSKKTNMGKAVLFASRQLNNATRVGVEFWKNNILSNVQTHVVNVTSVAMINPWANYVVRPVAAGVGKARTIGQTGADRVYMAESAAALASNYAGVRGSLKLFYEALKSGQSSFMRNVDKVEQGTAIEELIGHTKTGKAAAMASSGSFRMLRAEDDAMRGLAFVQELYALAARDGKMKDLEGDAFTKHMNEFLDNPPAEAYDNASIFAAQQTFTDTESLSIIGRMTPAIRKLVGDLPPLQFVIPFVNTPMRLLQYGVESSALSLGSSKLWQEIAAGGAKADIATAKMITGTGLSVSMWMMYNDGYMTGAGSENWKTNEMMRREGWQPNSWVTEEGVTGLERMGPFTISMNLTIGLFEKARYAKKEEDAKKYWALAALSMAENAFDPAWMGAAHDFVESFSHEKGMKTYISKLGQGFVPYSGLLSTLKKSMDPTSPKVGQDEFVSDISNMTRQRIMGNLPWLSEYVRPARYWDGTVIIPEREGFSYAMSPIRQGLKGKGHRGNQELLANGIAPPEPSSVMTLGPTKFSLLQLDETEELYDLYIQTVGKARAETIKEVVLHGKYRELTAGPNSEKFTILSKAVQAGNLKGKVDFLKGLESKLDRSPELINKMTKLLAVDPKQFVRAMIEDVDSQIKGTVKYRPTRKPFEIPRMK